LKGFNPCPGNQKAWVKFGKNNLISIIINMTNWRFVPMVFKGVIKFGNNRSEMQEMQQGNIYTARPCQGKNVLHIGMHEFV
jgi:hypothetical protein